MDIETRRSQNCRRCRWERVWGTLLGTAMGIMLGINSTRILSGMLQIIPMAASAILLIVSVIVYARMPKQRGPP